MGYTIIDGAVLMVVVISTILAWSRGFVRESMSILGWIVALVVAAKFAHIMVPIVEGLPIINEYLEGNCELLTSTGFVVLFVAMMILMAFLTPIFSSWVQGSFLSSIDGGLGALFGFARGVVIILLLLIVYDNFIANSSPVQMVEQSRSYAIFADPKASVEEQLPDQDIAPGWLSAQFNSITAHCTGSSPDA